MTALGGAVLRPLRMGEILDRGIRLYRRNFWQFVGVVAVVQIPLAMLQFLATMLTFSGISSGLDQLGQFDPTSPNGGFSLFGPGYAIGNSLNLLTGMLNLILLQGIATAVLTRLVAASYLGNPIRGIVAAYRRSKDAMLPLLLGLLLMVALAFVLLIWWVVPCIGWLTGGGMLLFLGQVIYPLLVPAIVIERQPLVDAWRRAWNLARRRFWWLLGFALVLYLINLVFAAGPAGILAMISQLVIVSDLTTPPSTLTLIGQSLLTAAGTLVATLIYVPLQVACFTVVYFDLRVRTEGLDLVWQSARPEGPTTEELMSDKEDTAGIFSRLASSAPPAGTETLVTWSEMAQFALITVGLIGIFFALYAALTLLVLGVVALAFALNFITLSALLA